jgi:multiple sugar transport system permease protein
MAFQVGVQRRAEGSEVTKRSVFYLILIVYSVITATPFVWSILTSFKTLPEASKYPPTGLPLHWTTAAWQDVLTHGDFPRWFLNSVIVAVLVTLGNLFFDSLGGYAFARMRFPGRNAIFFLVLGTLMIPSAMTLVPVYVILVKMPGGSWINTYQGLTVPFMVSAFGLFLMRQFFQSLPIEIEEAARLDGLGRFGIYWRIALPLARPALATLALLTFQGSWDSFLMPRFIASTPDRFTLPVGLQSYSGEYLNYWPQMMAGSMIIIVPILIIYLFAQRFFIEGTASAAVKG